MPSESRDRILRLGDFWKFAVGGLREFDGWTVYFAIDGSLLHLTRVAGLIDWASSRSCRMS